MDPIPQKQVEHQLSTLDDLNDEDGHLLGARWVESQREEDVGAREVDWNPKGRYPRSRIKIPEVMGVRSEEVPSKENLASQNPSQNTHSPRVSPASPGRTFSLFRLGLPGVCLGQGMGRVWASV